MIEILQLSGYETRGFSSGEEALASVKKAQPDLILLDLKMNGKSGFDVAKELKSDPETEDIPVIIVSAFISDKDMVRLLEDCKLKRCLQKPVKPLNIIFQIEDVFSEINDGKGKNESSIYVGTIKKKIQV